MMDWVRVEHLIGSIQSVEPLNHFKPEDVVIADMDGRESVFTSPETT